ncbi:MAG: 50S ribosomal protein L21 [Geminicoccaceae bacterium]
MYAVNKTGGKQYRVASDDLVRVEKLNAEVGSEVTLPEVLAVGGEQVQIGTPLVDGASVSATVVDHVRGPKLVIFKKRRRKNSRRKTGHRQDLTVLRIGKISVA